MSAWYRRAVLRLERGFYVLCVDVCRTRFWRKRRSLYFAWRIWWAGPPPTPTLPVQLSVQCIKLLVYHLLYRRTAVYSLHCRLNVIYPPLHFLANIQSCNYHSIKQERLRAWNSASIHLKTFVHHDWTQCVFQLIWFQLLFTLTLVLSQFFTVILLLLLLLVGRPKKTCNYKEYHCHLYKIVWFGCFTFHRNLIAHMCVILTRYASIPYNKTGKTISPVHF